MMLNCADGWPNRTNEKVMNQGKDADGRILFGQHQPFLVNEKQPTKLISVPMRLI